MPPVEWRFDINKLSYKDKFLCEINLKNKTAFMEVDGMRQEAVIIHVSGGVYCGACVSGTGV
jgi:hypothetical protein